MRKDNWLVFNANRSTVLSGLHIYLRAAFTAGDSKQDTKVHPFQCMSALFFHIKGPEKRQTGANEPSVGRGPTGKYPLATKRCPGPVVSFEKFWTVQLLFL